MRRPTLAAAAAAAVIALTGLTAGVGTTQAVAQPTQEQESDIAYAAAQAEYYGAGGGAVCGTDAQCAAYDADHQ